MDAELKKMLVKEAAQYAADCAASIEQFTEASDILTHAAVDHDNYGYIRNRPTFLVQVEDLGKVRKLFGRLKIEHKDAETSRTIYVQLQVVNHKFHLVRFRYSRSLPANSPCRVIEAPFTVPTLVCTV